MLLLLRNQCHGCQAFAVTGYFYESMLAKDKYWLRFNLLQLIQKMIVITFRVKVQIPQTKTHPNLRKTK